MPHSWQLESSMKSRIKTWYGSLQPLNTFTMSTVCPRHTDKILTTAKSNNYQQSEADIVLSQMQQRPGPCKSEKNGWSYIKYQLVNLTSFLQCPDIILPSQFVDCAEWVEAPAIERFVLCKESDRSSHLHADFTTVVL